MRSLLPAGDGVDLDAAYALPPGRHLRANFVSALDGAAESDGQSGPLGGPADKDVFRTLRWLTDVVLVGAGTVRAEGYGPAKIPADRQAFRRSAGLGAVPPIAVVTKRLDLEPDQRLFTEEGPARPLVLTVEAVDADRRAAVAKVADVILCGDVDVDLAVALDELADRGLGHVLCEGGPTLFANLVSAGLVDELCLTAAPVLAGPGHAGITGGPPWDGLRRMTLGHALEDDGTLFLRYVRG